MLSWHLASWRWLGLEFIISHQTCVALCFGLLLAFCYFPISASYCKFDVIGDDFAGLLCKLDDDGTAGPSVDILHKLVYLSVISLCFPFNLE